jgi:hypothetical protein
MAGCNDTMVEHSPRTGNCLYFPYVIEEVSAGDSAAANERIAAIRSLHLMDTHVEIEALADFLLLGGGLPEKAR